MRILMFGWEFPPYISGGLGTACYGMTLGLSECGVDVIFVTPDLEKGLHEKHSHLKKMQPASGTRITLKDEQVSDEFFKTSSIRHIIEELEHELEHEHEGKVSFRKIDSPLTPYLNEESYILKEVENYATHADNIKQFSQKSIVSHNNSHIRHTETHEHEKTVHVKSGYGRTLFEEVHRYAQAAAKIGQQEEYDIIHAHDWITYPAGALAKKVSGKPLVVHVHATEFDRSSGSVNQRVYDIERMGFHHADKILAVSERTKQTVVNNYGVHPDKVHVVYNAVQKRQIADNVKEKLVPPLMKKEKRVLFMGRITHQKGPEYFVEAAKLVYDKMPNVRFIMAGSGDMIEAMIKKVSELRIGSRFHFTGFIKADEVDKMYSIADVYVMPSVSEPFGIAPLEAMVCGTPALVSKQSGVAEVLKNTLKVDFWDVEELANKICTLLSYQSLHNVIVEKSFEELENISWNKSAKSIKSIYAKLHSNKS